jgi:hypothetical protein
LVLLKGLAAIFYFYPPQICKSASKGIFETSREFSPSKARKMRAALDYKPVFTRNASGKGRKS